MKYEQYFDRKQKKKCWRFDFTIAGKRIRVGGFALKDQAENAVAAVRLMVDRRKFGLPTGEPGYTVGNLLTMMEDDSAVRSRSLTIFRQFCELVGSSTQITNLSRIDFVDFLNFTKEKNLQPGSQKNYLDNVSTCLNKAGLYFPSMQDYRPPRLPPRPRPVERRRILTREELGKLFTTIVKPKFPNEHPESLEIRLKLFDIARLMLLTGARREELMTIKPADLRSDRQTLALHSSKVGKTHHIVLGDLGMKVLQSRLERTPAGKGLFEGINNSVVTKVLTRVSQHAGLEYGQRTETGWSLHDFRRTAATIIEDAGLPYSAVSAQLGHKRSDITARYTVPQIATMRKAAEALEYWCLEIDGILGGSKQTSDFKVASSENLLRMKA